MHKMPENSKKKRFVEAGKFNQFDTKTQKLLEDVDRTQNGLAELNQRTVEEILALEQRNRELRKPWYDQRAAAIAQIPNFWVTTVSFFNYFFTLIIFIIKHCPLSEFSSILHRC